MVLGNKKGATRLAKVFIALFVLAVIIGVFVYNYPTISSHVSSAKDEAKNSIPIGDALSSKYGLSSSTSSFLNFISFFIGKLPSALIISLEDNVLVALLVMVLFFASILFIFADIFQTFGSFSDSATGKSIPWLLAIMFSLIIVNMGWLSTIILTLIFIFGALPGALVVVLAICMPIVLSLIAKLLVLDNLSSYLQERKDHAKRQVILSRANEDASYIQGLKTLARGSAGRPS